MFPIKRILIPTDLSEASDEALKQALILARQYQATIYLLHVWEPMTYCAIDMVLDSLPILRAEDGEILKVKEIMRRKLDRFSYDRDIETIINVRKGDPVTEIIKEQEEQCIHLTVMFSHYRARPMRWLRGQVSEAVAKKAKSSVLLVRH